MTEFSRLSLYSSTCIRTRHRRDDEEDVKHRRHSGAYKRRLSDLLVLRERRGETGACGRVVQERATRGRWALERNTLFFFDDISQNIIKNSFCKIQLQIYLEKYSYDYQKIEKRSKRLRLKIIFRHRSYLETRISYSSHVPR